MFSENKANRAVRFFENLKLTQGEFYGKPFELQEWNRPIVRNVYGTLNSRGYRQYRIVWIEVAKKNAKSQIGAGAGLFHTFADGEQNGEVYGCASDRSQARICFDVAVDMIDQVPALKKRAKLTPSQNLITDRVSGSFYKVVSAEAYTKHGLNVSACIFDEIHAQPNRELWDVMTFGAGAARRQPIWWVITTAGDDPDRTSIGWELHEKALRVMADPEVDPTWLASVHSYEGDDIYNESNWYKANPSLGVTMSIESVREEAARAKQSPADERLFRWLRLNQWITFKLTSWLPMDLFYKTEGGPSRAELVGKECYTGLDLSSTTDLTARCHVFPPQSGLPKWHVIWDCWIPEENMRERIRRDHVPYDVWAAQGWVTATPGNVVDYNYIEQSTIEDSKTYFINELISDPALATMLLQRLDQAGIRCVPLAQTFALLSDPMNTIEMLLNKGEMTHEPNPVAAWCFGNTSIAKNGQGYIKFVKETKGGNVIRTKRIDLVAAWVDAMARAKNHQVDLYETRGMLSL